jgi:LPS-assembly protein
MRHVGLPVSRSAIETRGAGRVSARCRTWLLAGAAVLAIAPAAMAQTLDDNLPPDVVPSPELNTPVAPPVADTVPTMQPNAAEIAGLRGLQPPEPPGPPPAQPVAPPPVSPSLIQGPDGLSPQDTYLESDLLIDDPQNHVVIARGSVESRHGGRVLRADEVTYNTDTGAAHAHGHVMVVSQDGSVEYSDDVELDKELKAGVAIAFAARLSGNVTIAAGAALRRTAEVNELRNAIYTPCNICKADGVTPKNPTWSIQASKVIEDHEHQVVYYRNAIIRIKGIPVLYAPIFWHPDPDAPRRSGLLAPKIRYARRLGLAYEQPYLWAISPYADLVISPILTANLNPFLNLEYRQRFYSGVLNARVGYTYEKQFDSDGKYGDATSRSYILADGQFQLSDTWRWGFGLERVSDPTLFARYRIEDIYRVRGPFTTDTQRLISQVYVQHQTEDSFFSAAALSFQSLRVTQLGDRLISQDPTDAFPFVGPMVEWRVDPNEEFLGGRMRFIGSAGVLTRNQDLSRVAATGPVDNQAIDDRRVSGEFDWRRTFTFENGLRAEPFLQGRIDGYSINNPLGKDHNFALARGIGTVGLDLSYPFIRQTAGSTIILEPLVQLDASPTVRPNKNIPNEDSVALEFNATNLFSPDHFPGYDLYETGLRANVGERATINWGQGRSASVLVGRSFRDTPDPNFYVGSGLEGKSSDWVTAVTLNPLKGLSLFSNSRLDGDTLRVREEEAGFDISAFGVSTSARYLYSELNPQGVRTESINLAATANITKNWGVSGVAVRDLNAGLWPLTQLTVFYHDECIRVDFIYTHDQTYAGAIVPSDSLQVRLTLATLGGQGR